MDAILTSSSKGAAGFPPRLRQLTGLEAGRSPALSLEPMSAPHRQGAGDRSARALIRRWRLPRTPTVSQQRTPSLVRASARATLSPAAGGSTPTSWCGFASATKDPEQARRGSASDMAGSAACADPSGDALSWEMGGLRGAYRLSPRWSSRAF